MTSQISFHGAAREVTGSCHLIERPGQRLLLDCGMVQGGKERHQRNREPFPFAPGELDAVVLSHAHIDHAGRLPLLVKSGFRGPILATAATVELCRIMLADSGRIQEEDARWKIKRLRRKGEAHAWVRPLYTEQDALESLERFVPVRFDRPQELPGGGQVTFVKAGHILGAAIVQLEMGGNGDRQSITFSGDLGVDGARLLSAPTQVPCPDYLLIESTYGDRARKENSDKTETFYRIIRDTVDRGGKVVIPAFAVGRTQAVLARINDLVEDGRLRGVPVYVDSPMAIAATQVFSRFPKDWSDEARRKRLCDKPLEFEGLHLTSSVEESKAINERSGPAVIISASGMATAGRIKHHLANNLSDPASTVLFVGYQAEGSLGRVILRGTNPVRIFGDWYPVRARIESIEGFSAHADRDELLEWYAALDGKPRCTYVVHGEEKVSLSFGKTLEERFGVRVVVPRRGQSYPL